MSKMVGKIRKASQGAVLCLCLSACGDAGGQGYAIQAGAYPSSSEAAKAAESLYAAWAPVTIDLASDGSGFPYKVRVGRFAVYAEALAVKRSLAASDLPGSFIVPVTSAPPASHRDPAPLPFDTEGLEQPEPADGPLFWETAGLLANGEGNSGSESAEQLEAQLIGASYDTQSNQKRLKLARMHSSAGNAERTGVLLEQVRLNGRLREQVMSDFVGGHADLKRSAPAAALSKFRKVAGNRQAPPSVRRVAMRRAAGTLHKMRDYPGAWLAFGQVAANAASDPERAEARMQQAGLAFEMVESGKGSWEEVRALCQEVTEDPSAPRKTKATAALMHLETYWKENRFDEAAAAADGLRREYGDIPRESVMAAFWKALSRHRSGRSAEALAVFEKAYEEAAFVTDKFAGPEPRAYAAAWSALIAHKLGDAARRDGWRALLESEFPNSDEAIQLSQRLGR